MPALSFAGKKFDASGNLIKSTWGTAKHKSYKNRPAAVHGMKTGTIGGSDISTIKALKKKKCQKKKNVYSAAASPTALTPSQNCPDDDQ